MNLPQVFTGPHVAYSAALRLAAFLSSRIAFTDRSKSSDSDTVP